MSNKVRVRFAPSPTGHLHIGGLRAALFNFLYARHYDGTFLLRIEDTDLERSRPEYTKALLDGLSWVQLLPDEPVVIQTDFAQEHKRLIAQLMDQGKAYRCYCPADVTKDEFAKYDARCSIIADHEQFAGQPYVVRVKVPDWPKITFTDLIRGDISIARDQFDDFIIARSDGSPVYNFVVVADDAMMGITHVIRGEEHIANTPKQLILYHALGLTPPQFAHVPLILNERGSKLSKRDAATSVLDYKQAGYLPDALCNYLVRLGWSHGDQEIFSRQELISLFSLEGVGKKGAIFDIKKLQWVNHVYMQQLSGLQLLEKIITQIDEGFVEGLSAWSAQQICGLLDLYKERVSTLTELADALRGLYQQPEHYAPEDMQRILTDKSVVLLQKILSSLELAEDFSDTTIKLLMKEFVKNHALKLADIAQPLRLALTGKAASPGIFELAALIGQKETIERIHRFIAFLHR